MHLRSEEFKHIEMFSNVIYTAAFFRSILHDYMDVLFTTSRDLLLLMVQ